MRKVLSCRVLEGTSVGIIVSDRYIGFVGLVPSKLLSPVTPTLTFQIQFIYTNTKNTNNVYTNGSFGWKYKLCRD